MTESATVVRQRGLWFEELDTNVIYKHSPGRTISEADNTQYGPMQVQLVLAGKKITAVNVLQHTNTGVTSIQIDSNALPKLTSEALAAQSARIDAVSGASYTSAGYIQSLQSALDKARR